MFLQPLDQKKIQNGQSQQIVAIVFPWTLTLHQPTPSAETRFHRATGNVHI